ncbi:MAG: hypothetical protein AVO33_08360 [delta proteobacterium ML8_F1]|nr:MAG: hypothetical protein AVO33_08360 [delta proteobacterium ML8_F1]
MKVEIVRSHGTDVYEVPLEQDSMTVMDILDYIYTHVDHTLAYYKHSTCNQAICGRCLVTLDGKPALACAHRVDPMKERIRIAPARGRVVRDLVIEQD